MPGVKAEKGKVSGDPGRGQASGTHRSCLWLRRRGARAVPATEVPGRRLSRLPLP